MRIEVDSLQVDPVDDGVYDADILLTENQSDILLNDLGKVSDCF